MFQADKSPTDNSDEIGKRQEKLPLPQDDYWSFFSSWLHEHRQRVTESRKRVLEHIMSRDGHFCVEEVANDLIKDTRRVSRSTVYNTIALLVECGLVRAVRNCSSTIRYEAVGKNKDLHDHMLCENCGEMVEFNITGLKKSLDKSCKKTGFKQRGHNLIVFGLCDKCQYKPESNGEES